MRIVADTNTAVSGLLWQGPPRRLIDLARERALTLCTSLVLLAELAEVMGRPKFMARIKAAGLSAAALVQDYARLAELVEYHSLLDTVSRDPDDDAVLATALAAEARFIVSGDRDLIDLGTFRGVQILSATQALTVLGR